MIYVILGTKGQFTKMFPIMKLFDRHKVPYKFIHTSQHYGIIEDNIKRFKVRKPDVYLTLKKDDLRNVWDLLIWAPKVLWGARKLKIKREDWVLMHADTESTLLSFVIAKFFRAKTAHVESGLRSHNWLEPFPEEIIRTIVDSFSDINFCPYEHDAQNIRKKTGKVVTNGSVAFDSVNLAFKEEPTGKAKKIMEGKYVLFLAHRKENFLVRERVVAIIDILEEILKGGFKVVWPMHANTEHELKVKGVWDRILKLEKRYNLERDFIFDYVDFMHLVKNSEFIASDGGGLQKETYFINKPMLILRKKTEPEPGVGENSYLSYLDIDKVRYFLDNYKRFKTKTPPIGSPSKMIVDFFIKNK